jgi:hypothetical protein
MGATTHQRQRNSRWDHSPVLDERGDACVAKLTERDLEIFRLLVRYRYLPSDDIHAFIGGSPNAVARRLNLLSRKPNCYLARPHQQRENADANYRRLIYELDERGSRVLRERGLAFLPKSYHRNFAHELMVGRIMASIELGARADPRLRLITWPEILASDNTPAATRTSATPASIPVAFSLANQTCTINLTADARPFGIERNHQGQRSYLFFPGIEADCATEPIDASDFERSSILKKFAAYRAAVSQGLHRSHFGFPNFFVPFITTNTTRMASMMQLLRRMTDGRGSKMFLFTTFPALNSFEKPPPAGGHMLTRQWQRVGFALFSLTE